MLEAASVVVGFVHGLLDDRRRRRLGSRQSRGGPVLGRRVPVGNVRRLPADVGRSVDREPVWARASKL